MPPKDTAQYLPPTDTSKDHSKQVEVCVKKLKTQTDQLALRGKKAIDMYAMDTRQPGSVRERGWRTQE